MPKDSQKKQISTSVKITLTVPRDMFKHIERIRKTNTGFISDQEVIRAMIAAGLRNY